MEEEKTLKVQFTLPGKSRPRFMEIIYTGGVVNGFRQVYKKFPEAEIISFNGIPIRKKA
jgi:hypothetical protein